MVVRVAARGLYVGLGTCAFCGLNDAGHRVWDAVAGRVRAGEPIADVAADFEVDVAQVRVWIGLSDDLAVELAKRSVVVCQSCGWSGRRKGAHMFVSQRPCPRCWSSRVAA